MCPALFIPDNSSISTAVKHIYSKLSASASELDQGIPDIVLNLVSTNTNVDLNFKNKVSKGIGRIVSQCGLWLVVSGEQHDAFSSISTSVVKSVLPISDLAEETLLIVINSIDVAYSLNATLSQDKKKTIPMTDTCINTYYFILNTITTLRKKLEFRSQAAIKLANPPPALLIGVPYETSTSSGQTPSGSAVSPAIILPTSTKHDSHPLGVTIFCSTSLISIFELKTFLECGTPCLIIYDASDLCSLLRTADIFYRSSNFDHEYFMNWLLPEIQAILSTDNESNIDIQEIQEAICFCLQYSIGDYSLLSFISVDTLDLLPEHILEILMRCSSTNFEYRQVANLAVKLNVSTVLSSIHINALFNDEQFENLLVEGLSRNSRINVVNALLQNHSVFHVTPRLLMQWLDKTYDQDFFNIVIVGKALNYSQKLSSFNEDFANDLDYLLYDLSNGFANLFPSSYFSQPNPSKDKSMSIQILVIWAILLNKTELVKCLWAHSPEPLSLALLISRISKSLAFKSKEYFFYEEQLLNLSNFFTKAACTLLNQAYHTSPRPAYQTLCRKLQYNNQTLSNLAFETNNKEFISHECCQRWVLRLLYGNLQIGQLANCICVPNWIKIILSAILIIPIKFWIFKRPLTTDTNNMLLKNDNYCIKTLSPTVALLESGKPMRRIRASSAHSTHSARSYFHRDETNTTPSRDERTNPPISIHMGTETPKSYTGHHVYETSFMNDETDVMLADNKNIVDYPYNRKGSKKMRRSIGYLEFYKTPIVKFWFSLTLRLIYLLFFAYTVALPGCGITLFDIIIWVWSCFWLLDSIWVIHCRSCYGKLSNMRWQIFDTIVVTIFLITLMIFESIGHVMMQKFSFPSAYILKVVWCCLFIYQCYATLFMYISLSDLFGPLMVRIKLMITRDFVNFLILISIIMISSAIAVKSIVYPDLYPTPHVIKDSLLWAWMSLFTTDLSQLEQTDECKKSLLTPTGRDYCTSISGYGNHQCPTTGPSSFFVIIEYLIILKLISWPILFALFSKTAKEVDEEADQIWKYQLYSLATDFSYRLLLPPPLTPIALLFYACCDEKRCLSGMFFTSPSTSVDHPDIYKPSKNIESNQNSPSKYSVIYQNPSVPHIKHDPTKYFYCKAALNYWKNYYKNNDNIDDKIDSIKKKIEEKIHHLIIISNFSGIFAQSKGKRTLISYSKEEKLTIPINNKSWKILIPDYNPKEYSKPVEEFPQEIQKYVNNTTVHALGEICKYWRQKKLHQLLNNEKTTILLSSRGLPLNPLGRTGLAGRGNHIRFGPNKIQFYVIFYRHKTLKVLLTKNDDIPSNVRYDYHRADDYLSQLLTAIGIPDNNAQILSARGYLTVGQVDDIVAHVCTELLPSSIDTDNAWTEADIWAYNLTNSRDFTINEYPQEYKWKAINTSFNQPMRENFVKECLQSFNL